ncbi:hypothetical protein [Leisingera sp. ANG-M7]|uniref:hypothetical protein n=1 Tax=Leisingera sp. ANG-M7 TaxID=1577902 RepID=UPI00057E3349|nr:hypothetical protein [Leisingera sp. ANG-M7]KIC36811.1 hypothetical protein RA26_10830 [Leisingera sp. ANG-M7]
MEVVNVVWAFITSLGDQFVALAFTLVAALVFYVFRLRPILVFGRAHSSLHNLNLSKDQHGPPEEHHFLEIFNEQFFVQNKGRKPAADVSLELSHFPRNISINPGQKVSYEAIENGQCLIKVPFIAAGELITLDCIYLNQRAAYFASVRCSESVGKEVDFFTVQRFSSLAYAILWLLILFGMAFVVQFVSGIF